MNWFKTLHEPARPSVLAGAHSRNNPLIFSCIRYAMLHELATGEKYEMADEQADNYGRSFWGGLQTDSLTIHEEDEEDLTRYKPNRNSQPPTPQSKRDQKQTRRPRQPPTPHPRKLKTANREFIFRDRMDVMARP